MAKTRTLPDKYYDKDYETNGIHRVPLFPDIRINLLDRGRGKAFFAFSTFPLSIVFYILIILIFCTGIVAPVVAGVVAVPIAPRRYIRPIFRTIPAPNIVAPYLWIKYSIAECTRIKCVAVCLH